MTSSSDVSKSTNRLSAVLLAVLVLFWVAPAAQATPPHTFTLLYSFQGATGEYPLAGLVMDSSGNLYGTTSEGGGDGDGVIFKVTPDGNESVLQSLTGGFDGELPAAGLVFDSSGDIWGTTTQGGAYGSGTVFQLAPNGTVNFVYDLGKTKFDPRFPAAGVTLDADGNIYGTTQEGGAYNLGTIFKIDTTHNLTVLHSFKGNPTDGKYPIAGLILDSKGDFYGTTELGGASNDGTIFKVDRKGHETVLLSLDGDSGGGYPFGGVVMDASGNLYGATAYGGNGIGVVFELSPAGTETVLYTFNGGNDGEYPSSSLAIDPKGNLFGTTEFGGKDGAGTIFEITAARKFFVLHDFSGPDGADMLTNLVLDSSGNLYGTATEGGANGQGSVFKLTK
jgi:uncharacterized repeat protein (TIGR03803 family)